MNQVQASLLLTTEGPDRENLMSLKSDIEELINLTKESLQSIDDKHTNNEDDSIFSDEDNENLSKVIVWNTSHWIFLNVYLQDSDGDPNNVVTENLINLQVSTKIFCNSTNEMSIVNYRYRMNWNRSKGWNAELLIIQVGVVPTIITLWYVSRQKAIIQKSQTCKISK